MRVVVIGAGIAGLSAALTLARRARQEGLPLELHVLEAESRAGGHVGTVREDGFLIETGPNGFLGNHPATTALLDELGLGTAILEAAPQSRRRFLARGHRLHRLPASPLGLLTTRCLTLRGRLRLAREPWISPRQESGEETVLEFGRRRFGPEAAEVLGDAIVAGTSAGAAGLLSVEASYPILPTLERRYGSVVRGLIRHRRENPSGGGLRSLAGGMQTVVDAIVARLAVQLDSRVTGLTRDGGTWLVHRAGGSPLRADHVIAAVPDCTAAPWFGGLAPELAAALEETPRAGVVVVAFAWRIGDLGRNLDGYGYLVPKREGLVTLGMVWESSLYPGRAPKDWALCRILLGGMRTPSAMARSDRELLDLAETEAAPLLEAHRPPSRAWIFRWPGAIAQYGLGHRERVGAIREAAARTGGGGITLCGSSYDGVSFTAALESGAAAGEQVPLG